ncbi:MAG: hypothetical protein R6V44_05270 [Paracoccaceae bacterium]
MTTVPLSELLGLRGVPRDKGAAAAHLERAGVALRRELRNGGEARVADVADLPRELQAALWARWAEKAAGPGVDMGCADPALQEAFWRKPATVREKGFRKAEIALFGAGVAEVLHLGGSRGGDAAPGAATLRNWRKATEGLAPAYWAFALAQEYKGRTARAPMSEAAWEEFKGRLSDGHDWSLEEAW